MKKSETDRELIDLIKDTLDNHEEKYILGSWENFVRRKRRRKRLILWAACTGIAASVLIGWIGFRAITSGLSGSNGDRLKQEVSTLEAPVEKDTVREHIVLRQVPGVTTENKNTKSSSKSSAGQSAMSSNNNYQTSADGLNTTDLTNPIAANRYISDTNKYQEEGRISNLFPDTVKPGVSVPGYIADLSDPVTEIQIPDTSVDKPIGRQPDINITTENYLSDKTRSQKFRFGINFSPGVTSTSTSSSINYSGGINADYALSGKFQLSTGLQIEHQNVIQENSGNPAWIPSGQTQASLVDIDLPLNLTWKFLVRKSACYYIAGGISSVIYLSEKYTNTSYTQKMVPNVVMTEGEPIVTYQLENVKTIEQNTEAPLNTFDFAGRVNIILGFEHHLSSDIFLHFEPFIKIPISELATQNLRFTTSGITCKISF